MKPTLNSGAGGGAMNRCARWIRARLNLAGQLRAVRDDDRGSIMLLSAMMVFLVTIFAVVAMDTNRAIYNRIVAQNAVDSAADSAALWQARGCNLLQHLNNLHYTVNVVAAVAESISTAACIASVGLLAAEVVPIIGQVAHAVRIGTCVVCDLLPVIDGAQQAFYKIIMPIQQAIVDVTPFLAFANANACAKGSGADPLLGALLDSVQSILSKLGLSIPGFEGIAGAISGGLDWVPIYAAPINPSSLKLYVERKSSDDLPWDFPSAVGQVGDVAGQIGCADMMYNSVRNGVKSAGWDEEWGWDDEYFFGNPGFMTWIAGKKKRDELLGLGNLRWLNGGTAPGEMNYWLNQRNLGMYTGSATTGSGSKLMIPAFIAIASSQVEGTPVIDHGDVDAKGKLIQVYLSQSTKGESLLIYH